MSESRDPLRAIDDFKIDPDARLTTARELAANFAPDLDAVCEVDLHCHSFYSDGYHSPAGRVFEAWRRGLRAVAVADHDVFDGQLEAIEAGRIFDVDVVPAAEFYTNRPGIEIIAHFPDVDAFLELINSAAVDEVVEPIRAAKKKQLRGILDRIPACFAKLGFQAVIEDRDIDQFLRNGMSTKGDISVLMWQKYGPELNAKGVASDVKDFQARYTTRDDQLNLPLELDMDLSPVAFVRRVREWGGLPGLPHPSEFRKKENLDNRELRATIERLGAFGLQTIEVDGWRNGVCPETALHQTDLFEGMRRDYNAAHPDRLPLLPTNGSDDHNQPGEGLELGCGRDRNLRPEFGRHEIVTALCKRAREVSYSSRRVPRRR